MARLDDRRRIRVLPCVLGGAIVLVAVWISGTEPAIADEAARPRLLFAHETALELEFELDFKRICKNPTTGECEDVPATIYYVDAAAERRRIDVRLRTRGRWRRDTSNCAFPALFVYFDEDQTGGTLFEGQKMLPFTTHCQYSRKKYHAYMLNEHLAYRLYNLLTDASVQVRLAHIAYHDTGSRRRFTRYGFFSEHFDHLAERIGAQRYEVDVLDPRDTDATQLATLSVFQYMIGNLDWSVIRGHNIVLYRHDDGIIVPVPFDFDYSGLVDAEYAAPPEKFHLRSVRSRKYRGFCQPGIDWEGIFARFLDLRPDVMTLVDSLPGLRPTQRQNSARYLQQFYDTLESEAERRQHIVEACRRLPGAG